MRSITSCPALTNCGPEPAQRRRDRYLGLLLFLLAFCVYNANLRVIASADSRGTRYLPFAVLRDHSLSLESFADQVVLPGAYYVSWSHGRLWSSYPIVTPLLVVPLYVPVAAVLQARGWHPVDVGFAAAAMEKVSASVLAALSVALVFLLVRVRAPERPALLLAMAYGFGTTTWAISSQALWQHAAGELLLAAVLLALTTGSTIGTLAAAGMGTGLLAANRPPDALLAVAIIAVVLLRHRRPRERLVFLIPFAAVVALMLVYNFYFFGRLLGGYLLPPGSSAAVFGHPLVPGLAAELLSPGKGLFVYSPFVLFVLARRARGDFFERQLDLMLLTAIVAQLLLYARADWSGFCYGPRYLTDMLPAVMWLLAPAVAAAERRGRVLFVLGLIWAVAIESVGAFVYPRGGSDRVLAADVAACWRPANAQFVLELRGAARQEPSLLRSGRASSRPIHDLSRSP
jgi:hypothetical protein